MITEQTITFFDTLEKAEEVAHMLRMEEEDGWSYRVVPNQNAWIIWVYDENGSGLGTL